MATRVWKSMFGVKDDLEKKLDNLASEEKAVHARIKRRTRSSRQLVRHVIKISMSLEVFVVIYAILMGREPDLSWQIRSLRVLPVIAVPILATIIYFFLANLRKILEVKDKNRLEWLREERQGKINELKEKSNYYATQVLIQRYDLDPAVKAAAAAILASKLGTESGLKLSIGDKIITDSSNYDIISDDEKEEIEENNQKGNLENYKVPRGNNESWFAQIAALLVGEHPSQCFALICSNCSMHNGLVRKEDLPFFTYYCPHCRALNGSQLNNDASQVETPVIAVTGGPDMSSSTVLEQEVNENNAQQEEIVPQVNENNTQEDDTA